MRFSPVFVALLSSVSVFASRHRCGSVLDPEAIIKAELSFKLDLRLPLLPPRCKTVDVHFHVIHEDETVEGGYVPKEQIQKQMSVLNEGFAKTPFYFRLVDINYVKNATWFNEVDPATEEGNLVQSEMKAKLRVGGKGTLNMYTLQFSTGLLGYATFPSTFEEEPAKPLSEDGVVIHHATLPGGTFEPYNLGATTTHEVGHWVGLYHVFQGEKCEGEGDYVDDTPLQSSPSFGCPTNKDSCPVESGLDSIHNFMDYSDDSCLTEFSRGQIRRMTEQMKRYRKI